jgi:gliding motility-associated-like protein
MKHRILFIALFISALFNSAMAQTILAPDLQCVQNDVISNNITLSWTNPPANPCGAFVQYTIYASQSGPAGPYNPVAVTSQSATSFVLNGYLGIAPTWNFYMEAQYNCPGATVLQSDTVNNQSPVTPAIVNVDVTPTGEAIFNWQQSPSPQTQFYIAYYFLPSSGLAVTLDTIYGRDNTTFTDPVGQYSEPTTEPLYFTIAAVDSCGKISAYSTSPHNTLFAQAGQQACQSQVDLTWNRYANWPLGPLRYEIWASRNDSAYTKVAEVDTGIHSFNYTTFNDGDSLQLYIRAISAADTTINSRSNVMRLRAAIVQPPRYNYITNATVGLDNHITITWLIDTLAELTFYKIQRSTNNVSYDPIAQRPAPSPLTQFDTYDDSTGIIPANNPYFYQQVAFDSCQTQYPTPYVKTVCLKGELYDYYVANLTWNNFELQGATVTRYNLYRNITGTYQLLRSFAPGVNTYSDSLQEFLDANGIFCYRIEAVYDLSLPDANYTATLSSWSNEQCIIHRPIIYVPNAFAPNGVNNVFKPTIIYGDPKGYSLSIFNRWGAKIFESNDPATGWDGTDHGKEAQLGAYAYLIQFYANDGVKVERKGMVLLVK